MPIQRRPLSDPSRRPWPRIFLIVLAFDVLVLIGVIVHDYLVMPHVK